ncbi:hypothetical protein BDK51DRAFT_38179 [Blyttiomyces helicus]|uniref:Uncharacterized protein n=1 Tax=Blyttiomyces helicus TaxID=388810 RepID=A0A4P9W3S0_9FUNG|nr:hypothetical protein BDK51DRAFT_38179 [Blyttiomyces helicus]|eukprot:RKO86794.1 hypothetical protein BDK51DRAFT_38179 [Blyttiomyces helicus]
MDEDWPRQQVGRRPGVGFAAFLPINRARYIPGGQAHRRQRPPPHAPGRRTASKLIQLCHGLCWSGNGAPAVKRTRRGTSKPFWDAELSAAKGARNRAHQVLEEAIRGSAMQEVAWQRYLEAKRRMNHLIASKKQTRPNALTDIDNMNPSELLKAVSNLRRRSSGNPTSSALPTEPTSMDSYAAHYESVSADQTQPSPRRVLHASHSAPRLAPSSKNSLSWWQSRSPLRARQRGG